MDLEVLTMKLVKGDITQECSDGICKLLPKTLTFAVQRELRSKAPQRPGAVLMTSPGLLSTKNIIHMVVGSGNKQHLQTCVEDSASFDSLSIPAVGSGGLGLSPEDSAEVVFEEIVACVPQRAFPIRS